jgi:DNA helicase II / ATP-dependent DNA helicase PcrA
MNYSAYQTAIFDFAANGAGNAVVEAVAGSGKTTTMVESLRRVPASVSKIFLAFNKSIQLELQSRGVNAKTFHGLCFVPVTRALGIKAVSADKIRDLIDARMGDDEAKIYGAFVNKLVSLGKNSGIGCLIEDTEQNWNDLAQHHDLELDSENADYAKALRYASEILQVSNVAPSLDFDDLLYLAVKNGIQLPKFDFIVVDEAQDTNAIQRAIIRKIMKPSSRLMAVGDSAQAIYGFRGSDSNSLGLIASEFDAIKLPLTVSYRCPTAVIAHARKWVNHIEAAPGAPEGSVTSLGDAWKAKDFVPHDLVVCRTTRPLIGLAYMLLQARVPVRIMGKEIGAGLKALVKRMNAKGVDNLIMKLQIYTGREVEKARAKKQDQKVEMLQDKTDCVVFLIRSLQETNRTIPALNALIDQLFSDQKNTVILSTIHKSKGLESNTVYWLNSSKCPAKWAKQKWQQDQELNICYVAATRAKQRLILIEDEAPKDE